MAALPTPVENAIRRKINEAFKPTSLEILNESHRHSHHKAMENSESRETHFRVYIVSDAFASKMQPARHRMVYSLLKDELAAQGGIHALRLRTRTTEEDKAAKEKDKALS